MLVWGFVKRAELNSEWKPHHCNDHDQIYTNKDEEKVNVTNDMYTQSGYGTNIN